jgi:hypothetical protein
MFTTTPLPEFGDRRAPRRGTAGGCEPCRRGTAGGSPPSVGAAFLVGAVAIIIMAAI